MLVSSNGLLADGQPRKKGSLYVELPLAIGFAMAGTSAKASGRYDGNVGNNIWKAAIEGMIDASPPLRAPSCASALALPATQRQASCS